MPRRRTNRSAPRPADLDALVLTRQVTAWLRICTRTGPAYQWAASSLLAAFPAIGREYLKMVEQAEQVPAGPSSVPLTVHLPQPLPTPHSPLPTPHSLTTSSARRGVCIVPLHRTITPSTPIKRAARRPSL